MKIALFFMMIIFLATPGCGPTAVENAPPGIVAGKITLFNVADPENAGQWFDFSEGRIIIETDEHKQGDFCLFGTHLRSVWPVECGMQDSQPDSLWRHESNPTYDYKTPDEFKKNADVPIYSGHVYYMVTGEGHYARIKVVGTEMNDDASAFNSITFYWGYQPDGTEVFVREVDDAPPANDGEETGE